MTTSSTCQDVENDDIRTDETDEYNSASVSIMRTPDEGDNDDRYPPFSTSPSLSLSKSFSASYVCSFFRSCCTFQHFCYCVQLVNCGLVCALIALAIQEYPKIEALQAQVEEDRAEVAILEEEVRDKQEGQIQTLHQQVMEGQQFNFLTLAGFFTLLTCLISMFHMSTHLHKHNQPKIQRKIIAILWMSPIYSVTSFLTLVFPSVAGWMAIIKDFYESYCIYVFLSFLIAVLGEGSRDQAVEVLAKHATHLDSPTRCLSCFYEPPPDTSDHAKANAVMTECQIYCLQFTLIRPLTTIFSVFVLHRDQETTEEKEENYEDFNNGDEFKDDNTVYNNNNTSSDFYAESPEVEESSSLIDSSSSNNNSNNNNSTNMGHRGRDRTRTLIYDNHNNNKHAQLRRNRNRGLQQQQRQQQQQGSINEGEGENTENIDDGNNSTVGSSTGSNGNKNTGIDPDTASSNSTTKNNVEFSSPAPIEGSSPVTPIKEMFSTFAPSLASNMINTLVPTVVATIVGSLNSNITTTNNNTAGSITDGVFATASPSDAPTTISSFLNETINTTTSFGSSQLVDETKAYFKSPGFVVAMVVNISIFFAFTGLLKLYHAVRDDLKWCRPFPKFLTIKAVVFLTFWQGLAILLWLVLTADSDEKGEASLRARKYQNLLICLEMLLVAISQWCVFPADEWEPNYEPHQMHTPGLGIKDFVSDVGQIVKNTSGRSRRRGRKGRRKSSPRNNSKNDGLYYQPGTASANSSLYDDGSRDGSNGHSTIMNIIDSSFDSSNNEDIDDEYPIQEEISNADSRYGDNRRVRFRDNQPNYNTGVTNGSSLPCHNEGRQRMMSDDTHGTGEKADDENSDDMELL